MAGRQKYEYKFVRLGEGVLGAKTKGIKEYRQVVEEHARDGWRLVQVFAPSLGIYGAAKYFEIIFERQVQ